MTFMRNELFTDVNKFSTRICDLYSTASLSPFVSDNKEIVVFPGFCDVHVHLREPGFSYKETIRTGSMAAARGGYSTVFSMPNLKPVPDNLESLNMQLDIINSDAVVKVIPYGSITKGQNGAALSDMSAMKELVCAFSDDGRGVQNPEIMKAAMLEAKRLDKIIVAHCEDNSLLHGGYIHEGKYAKDNNHRGICSESEYLPILRDIELAKETGAKYHVCHVSCKQSVEAIRQAKANGVDITCETAPHYLILCDEDLQEHGRFKMNPPLRSREDREALIEGILDGTIDMIATDHAPHSLEEKSKGLEKSAFGIVGLETSFPLMYTHLVKKGIISLEKICELMCINPRKRFGLEYDNSLTVFDLSKEYRIDPDEFVSMGKSTPFENTIVSGRCILNVIGGKVVWQENITEN